MSDNVGIATASRSGSFGSTSTGLLAGVKSRQPEAWSQLVEVYSPLVYGWCRRTGVAAGDAPDIVQEVFASVAGSIDDFRGDGPRGSFRAWLSAITRRRISDHFRAKLNQPEAEGGTEARARLMAVAEPTLSSDGEELADESTLVWQRVVELVRAEFEASTWQAFWRVAVDAVCPADAAEELGMSIPAVYKSQIPRPVAAATGADGPGARAVRGRMAAVSGRDRVLEYGALSPFWFAPNPGARSGCTNALLVFPNPSRHAAADSRPKR